MKNSNDFRISGLSMDPFFHLLTLSDTELASHQARRYKADSKPGFPCRVSLVDAEPGETVILLPYLHHAVGPYRSSGPIFVRENARPAELGINELPEVVRNRLMSVRAYDSESLMLASAVVEGPELATQIEEFFADERVAYLHLHNAKPGCYSCRADRA
jgi:hypothetical protein